MALAATRETAKEKRILTAIKAIRRLVKYPNARAADPRRTKRSFDISARPFGFELVSSCVRRRVDGERSSSWRGSSRLQISGDAAPISVARRFGGTTGDSGLLSC